VGHFTRAFTLTALAGIAMVGVPIVCGFFSSLSEPAQIWVTFGILGGLLLVATFVRRKSSR